MFGRMIKGILTRQWKKMLMIGLTIALGASLATAMLSVMLDVGDKINQELKAYGANIIVSPQEASVIEDLYDVEGGDKATKAYLREDELSKVKTIFWAFNIVDYSPFISTSVKLDDGSEVKLTGSWFNHHLELATGETLDSGIRNMRSWWDIEDGDWIDEQGSGAEGECMVGTELAKKLGISVGDSLHVTGNASAADLTVKGIFDAGGDEDEYIFTTLDTAQAIGGLDGKVDTIEVSALTTPDNELSEKAAKDPGSLTIKQYETWYCTAYASAICYQLTEVITDSTAAPVRQVASSEGAILDKTELLMGLIAVLSMVGSALGICNLVTASVMDRSREIGLMKAIGAQNSSIILQVITEILITAAIGGAAGFAAGIGFAQIIGQTVFGSSIALRTMVIPIVIVAVLAITLIGCIPAIRQLLKLSPTEVLHE
ncbi:MAG: ABC transporter permease [Lachnospiraceae bacterium]|nr:ABC transporter permease [Lachnospiraceae bacterium]